MNVRPDRANLPHYAYLDALRGIAAIGVIIVHAAATGYGFKGETMLTHLAPSGQRGVELFYVVSAFTIFLSLDSRSPNEKRPTRNFFIRRFFRIAPLYYLAIVANILLQNVAGITTEWGKDTPWDLLLAFTFTHGLSAHSVVHGAIAGWSIGVEVVFYLAAPFLFSRVGNVKQAVLLVLAACAIFPVSSKIMNHFLHADPWPAYLWLYSPGIEMPVFCFGILAYFLWKARGSFTYMDHRAASLMLIAISVEIFVSSLPNSYTTMLWSSFAFCPLLRGLSLHAWPLIVNRATIWAGKISYSIYLWHMFAMYGCREVLRARAPQVLGTQEGFVVLFVATVCVTLPIAWLSHRFVEKPGIGIGKKLIVRLEGSTGSTG